MEVKMLLKEESENGSNLKSFREKRSEFRHKIVDGIYDKIPVDVVEHLGNANKEIILAVESVFDVFVKRIDQRIAKTKERRLKTGDVSKSGSEDEDE